MHSGSQNVGHTRPVIAGIGLKSLTMRAASVKLPVLTRLRYDGMAVEAGQWDAQG